MASWFPLTCGHPSEMLQRDHPVWSDPSTPLFCEQCDLDRQANLTVQLDLYKVILSDD